MTLFDKEATTYDSWYQTPLGNYVFEKESNLLLEMIGNVNHKSILDVGCATGIHTVLVSNETNSVIGIDLSEAMILEAKKKEKDNLQFLQMDALHLEFEDNQFDIIFSATMIEFVTNRQALITELLRVLKPGGLFVLGTIQKDSHFFALYQTRFFQTNTVFKYANFMSLADCINLAPTLYINAKDCLYHKIEDIEANPKVQDQKQNKVGSFLVSTYRKDE